MIDLDGKDEAEVRLIADQFAMRGQHIATEGAKMLCRGGTGMIMVTPHRGLPTLAGRAIVIVGTRYAMPRVDYGNPCCPHYCSGEIDEGAEGLTWRDYPVAMVRHRGTHRHICGGASDVAVIVDGWKHAYHAAADYGLDTAKPKVGQGFSSQNIDAMFATFRNMPRSED